MTDLLVALLLRAEGAVHRLQEEVKVREIVEPVGPPRSHVVEPCGGHVVRHERRAAVEALRESSQVRLEQKQVMMKVVVVVVRSVRGKPGALQYYRGRRSSPAVITSSEEPEDLSFLLALKLLRAGCHRCTSTGATAGRSAASLLRAKLGSV